MIGIAMYITIKTLWERRRNKRKIRLPNGKKGFEIDSELLERLKPSFRIS